MGVTVDGHYESVRFAPYINNARPFQILAFTEDWRGSVDDFLVIFMDVREAKDLHKSLGLMLNNVREDSSV